MRNAIDNKKAIETLYDYLTLNIDSYMNDIKNDYLTENIGRDKNTYLCYLDCSHCACINTSTFEIIDEELRMEELFW